MTTRIITDSNGRKHITNEPLLHQPAPVQESVKFLANGTRFKTSEFPYGVCINGLPKELAGRWVALVAAEDDCHLQLTTPPAAPAPITPAEVHGMAEAHGIDGDARHWYVVGIADSEKHHGITEKGQP
jgi:hypothetical protein